MLSRVELRFSWRIVLRALKLSKTSKSLISFYNSEVAMRLRFYILTFVFCVTGFMAAQDSGKNRILKLEELSQAEIDKLDRNKSAFILTFGNLEEHGPHLRSAQTTSRRLPCATRW